MVRELRPFIVTSWHGHRDNADLPEAVREVWKGKFSARPDPRMVHGRFSNVDLVILGPDGDVVHFFDAFPPRRSGRESLADETIRHLRYALSWFDDPGTSGKRPLELPDVDRGRGIRVFVSLKDDRMKAYQAPVVEAVALDEPDWDALAYPDTPREVEAGPLFKWLSQVYPPGVMERTNPATKKVYEVAGITGDLTLEPAGAGSTLRHAILRGDLTFTDEGGDGFAYKGTLEVVLTYPPDRDGVTSLRGVFAGIYPREDRNGRTRQVPLEAVFESRPE
ncbi:MAG: hypothetical protein HKN82_00705 [Akkermansiaceae bacterium]|nr:hypothetical protein [Akkermansiaceae bacterium]